MTKTSGGSNLAYNAIKNVLVEISDKRLGPNQLQLFFNLTITKWLKEQQTHVS